MNSIKYILGLFLILSLAACSEDTIDELGTGTITGTVLEDGTNRPLANVKISTTPVSNTVLTNSSGKFEIANVNEGEYSVQAELDDYITAFKAARVQGGETSNVIFELEKSTANNKAPAPAQLLFPADKQANIAISTALVWSSGANDDDQLTFSVELRNGTTGEVRSFTKLTDTIQPVSLSRATTYFWQVTSSDGINAPVLSKVGQFRTVEIPNNPYLFVRPVNGNSVIFSSDGTAENEVRLTAENSNSFRPRKNADVNKIAFLRTVGSDTHLFTMNIDGTGIRQVTRAIPLAGFRIGELDFTWAQNGSKIYYPYFDKLYSIDPDGGGNTLIYQTTDGSFISEVAATDFDDNLIAIKTNNTNGYNVRIYTVRLSSRSVENIVLENVSGAAGGLDLDANSNSLVYTRDLSGSENSQYRIFTSRIFIFSFSTLTSQQVNTNVDTGQNDLDPRWSPSEGDLIFTRVRNNTGAIPDVFTLDIDNQGQTTPSAQRVATNASQPDWE